MLTLAPRNLGGKPQPMPPAQRAMDLTHEIVRRHVDL
jgi:hypothetical protein